MYLVIPLVKFSLATFKLVDIIMKIIGRKYIYFNTIIGAGHASGWWVACFLNHTPRGYILLPNIISEPIYTP